MLMSAPFEENCWNSKVREELFASDFCVFPITVGLNAASGPGLGTGGVLAVKSHDL